MEYTPQEKLIGETKTDILEKEVTILLKRKRRYSHSLTGDELSMYLDLIDDEKFDVSLEKNF